jgi:hypothetical protein
MAEHAVKRHPVRGFFAGLCIGLGVAVLLFTYGVIALGTNAPFVVILVFTVLGVVWAYVAPPRRPLRSRNLSS